MQTNGLLSDIRVLATDLDGTIIGDASEFSLYSYFRNILNDIKSNNEFYWVVCTGRSLSGYKRLMKPMVAMGNIPDFVITRHAFIMRWNGKYYTPHIFWNIGVLYHLLLHNLKVKASLNNAYKAITTELPGSRILLKHKHGFTVRFKTDDAAKAAKNICQTYKALAGNLAITRNGVDVTVGVMPFSKGISLAELISHLGITADNVLAIGNGINDLTLLTDKVAKYTGCPRNSKKEVMDIVKTRGGHIASRNSLAGVIEILEAYKNSNICSEVPEFLEKEYSSSKANSSTVIATAKNKASYRRQWRYSMLKALVLIYIVLLVFASFDLIPFVSHIIFAPYNIMIRLLSRLFISY